MSKFKTIIMYFVLAVVTLVLLSGIVRVEKHLDSMVKENHLRFAGHIQNAPPLVTFTTVALGSFRGLIADMLWFRAGGLQERGNYFEMVQLARWITDLQPTFSGATAYLAWNMAYNISVTCSGFDDRWRWVNEGIKLIRDRALEYNPEDPVLYKELGWIYQHKLGNIMDDANLYYKNQQALLMTSVLGAKPDFAGMAAAPVGEKEFRARYPETSPVWNAMKEAKIENLDQLYADFKKNDAELPPAFVTALRDPALAQAVTNYCRAAYLREKFKLDARVMHEIDQEYGQLDWRVPESQAIYWATMGLKRTPGHVDLNCQRVITQSLYEAFRAGRLLLIDEQKFESVMIVPNLALVDAVYETFTEAQKTFDKGNSYSTFRSAKINFMKEAITILYNYGKFSKSAEYYELLRKEEPGSHRQSLESFVMDQWLEDVRDAAVKKASEVISGLIFRSINYMVYNDQDAAVANERIARYIYTKYAADLGREERTKLLPYADMKKAVVEQCIKVFPPAMVEILKAKVAAEQAEAAAEKKNSAEEK